MKDSLFCALMLAAIVSIGDVAFCDDQSGTQQTAQLNRQVKVQMDYLLYPGVRIFLETNTWVDPEHYSGDQKVTIRFNERMNSTWEVVRQLASERKYPLVEICERKKKETMARNWDQRIRNQKMSQDKFGRRILDGSKDEEMEDVVGWFVDNHPNANRPSLAKALEEHGIEYHWLESLGGHRKEGRADSPNFGIKDDAFRNYADHMLGDEFREGVDRLLEIAENKRVAIMCAEKSFYECHRKLTIDYLVAGGAVVQHILADGKLESHKLSVGQVLVSFQDLSWMIGAWI